MSHLSMEMLVVVDDDDDDDDHDDREQWRSTSVMNWKEWLTDHHAVCLSA